MYCFVIDQCHTQDPFGCTDDVHPLTEAQRLNNKIKFHLVYVDHLLIIPDDHLVRGIVRVFACGHEQNDVGVADHLNDGDATFECSLYLLHKLRVDRVYPKTIIGRQRK